MIFLQRLKFFSGSYLRKLVIIFCLTPSTFIYYKNIKNICANIKNGKYFFSVQFENADQIAKKMRSRGFPVGYISLAMLIFAIRLYQNKSFFISIRQTVNNIKHYGLSGLISSNQIDMFSDTDTPIPFQRVLNVWNESVPQIVDDIPQVTVVIPIYNGIKHLEKLIPDIICRSPRNTYFIFIDDCSSDLGVKDFLISSINNHNNCLLVCNSENTGFVKTVNKGMAMVKTPLAVIANTDIAVPNGWLERLLSPFSGNRGIASATPFSNSAVFFSFPRPGQDNVLIPPFTLDEVDGAFSGIKGDITPECRTHSGVGFCMAINMACWHEIGPFDETAFGKGYGEETDWCMRADSKGWSNVLVPNLFVQHSHGGTFLPEEKARLCSEHLAIITKRWPKQIADMHRHVATNPWSPYRALASLRLADGGKGCLLLIDWQKGGSGAYEYRKSQLQKFLDEGWRVLLLTYNNVLTSMTIDICFIDSGISISIDISDIEILFEIIHIKYIFINNIAFFKRPEELIKVLKRARNKYKFYLEYVLHDFLCVCPSFFLLDMNDKYCSGGSEQQCKVCIKMQNNKTLYRENINTWRLNWSSLFSICDNILCFSFSTVEIVTKIFNISNKISVCEHAPLCLELERSWSKPTNSTDKHTIAFIGNFEICKGRNIILEIADKIKLHKLPLHIVVMGRSDEIYQHSMITFHGAYNQCELPAILEKYAVKAALFPSICPETFSYVAQEIMLMELPMVCFNLGAPAERIRKYAYPHAEIAREISADSMLQALDVLLTREYGIRMLKAS